MGASRVYLDSYYLLEILNKGNNKEDVQSLLYKLAQPSFEVFIPQAVLGEVISNILAQDRIILYEKLEQIPRIITRYNIDAGSCLVPPKKEMFDIMTELRYGDDHLDGTDIIITAQALVDPDSKFFFTPDKKLLANNIIEEYEENMRKEGRRDQKLKITERL